MRMIWMGFGGVIRSKGDWKANVTKDKRLVQAWPYQLGLLTSRNDHDPMHLSFSLLNMIGIYIYIYVYLYIYIYV